MTRIREMTRIIDLIGQASLQTSTVLTLLSKLEHSRGQETGRSSTLTLCFTGCGHQTAK
jgi:hypothetical protein